MMEAYSMYSKWNSETSYPPSAPQMHTGQSSQQMNQRLKISKIKWNCSSSSWKATISCCVRLKSSRIASARPAAVRLSSGCECWSIELHQNKKRKDVSFFFVCKPYPVYYRFFRTERPAISSYVSRFSKVDKSPAGSFI